MTTRVRTKGYSISHSAYHNTITDWAIFFNKKKGLAFEINFDHTKHIIQDGQAIRISGKLGNRSIDSTINFSSSNGFYYFLNNGANFLLFNLVKRWRLHEARNKNFILDAVGKGGIGPVIPHVVNSFFGNKNNDGFQLGGWNIGVETGLKATFFRHVFIEMTNKVDYARYSGLKVYQGTASQAFGTYELILSLGYTFPAGKKSISSNLSFFEQPPQPLSGFYLVIIAYI